MSGDSYAGNLLRDEYIRQSENDVISPTALADAVYKLLDPHRHAPQEVQHLAIMELRQLARQMCAARQSEQETRIQQEGIYKQLELFEGLQQRYPVQRGGEGVYALLEDLSEVEGRANAGRLRIEGRAKIGHADALDAYFDRKFGNGQQPVAIT